MIKKENAVKTVTLENKDIKAVILPALGGKTPSFYYKPKRFELTAANPKGIYRIPNRETPFADCDASGWDDAFPTILPGKLEGAGADCSYTDHGEIWRSPMKDKWEQDTLCLEYESTENPFRYQKKIRLEGHRLCYQYCIENTGEKDFPCMWTMHGLVRYEPDMELFYPEEVESFQNAADSSELGKEGSIHPVSGAYDFTHVPPLGAATQLKYYAAGKVSQGKCGYRYPSQGVRCTLHYDAEVLPYLGMWITAGGFRGDYNCAWEPAGSFYDGVERAAGNESLWVLKGHEKKEFCMVAELEAEENSRQQHCKNK